LGVTEKGFISFAAREGRRAGRVERRDLIAYTPGQSTALHQYVKFVLDLYKAEPTAGPTATQPAPSPDVRKVGAKRAWALKASVAAAVVILVGVLFAQLSGSAVRITSPANGATVGPVEDITGKGWEPKLNNYLIVEPVDQSGRRWVQGQIASPEWTRSAHFGQGDTPSGMRYRIYVLSTSTALPIGELTKQTDSPQESPAITVTLKK
jgi:hypothetical protein